MISAEPKGSLLISAVRRDRTYGLGPGGTDSRQTGGRTSSGGGPAPHTFGYRPRKSALDAIKVVQSALNQGYTDVVDADLSKYFDTIPHSELLKSIAARISDRHILRLIKMWLKAPVEERDENGGTRLTGGKDAKQGTPQGGVISPLLANRYMNRFLKYWAETGQPRHLGRGLFRMPMTLSF